MQKLTNIIRFASSLVLVAFLVTGCNLFNFGDEENIDISMIVGTWVRDGSYYEQYQGDGTGKYWDEGDDVYEDEAIPFTWEFESEDNTLIKYYTTTFGTVIPKSYTVVALDEQELKYEDDYGSSYVYTKVNR